MTCTDNKKGEDSEKSTEDLEKDETIKVNIDDVNLTDSRVSDADVIAYTPSVPAVENHSQSEDMKSHDITPDAEGTIESIPPTNISGTSYELPQSKEANTCSGGISVTPHKRAKYISPIKKDVGKNYLCHRIGRSIEGVRTTSGL